MKRICKILGSLMLVALLTSCGGPDEEGTSTDSLGWDELGDESAAACGFCSTSWNCIGPVACGENEERCFEVQCCEGAPACDFTGESGCFDPAQVPGPGSRPVCR